ncbi:MAG: Phosphoenolpyruvate synthase [Verrucomicrobia subdivision 3 bacterium]|nr:Phosphoenolpyruvate synthase [Limisphaerales bacterium]MCS1412464.1 Phosphoenolpyruvate synthase [Limisphaerales bacterium]
MLLWLNGFRTNEYANLLGGARFEPKEENPMIGFRSAPCYYNPRHQEGFALARFDQFCRNESAS